LKKAKKPSWVSVAARIPIAMAWMAKGENWEPKTDMDWPIQNFMKSPSLVRGAGPWDAGGLVPP